MTVKTLTELHDKMERMADGLVRDQPEGAIIAQPDTGKGKEILGEWMEKAYSGNHRFKPFSSTTQSVFKMCVHFSFGLLKHNTLRCFF